MSETSVGTPVGDREITTSDAEMQAAIQKRADEYKASQITGYKKMIGQMVEQVSKVEPAESPSYIFVKKVIKGLADSGVNESVAANAISSMTVNITNEVHSDEELMAMLLKMYIETFFKLYIQIEKDYPNDRDVVFTNMVAKTQCKF